MSNSLINDISSIIYSRDAILGTLPGITKHHKFTPSQYNNMMFNVDYITIVMEAG